MTSIANRLSRSISARVAAAALPILIVGSSLTAGGLYWLDSRALETATLKIASNLAEQTAYGTSKRLASLSKQVSSLADSINEQTLSQPSELYSLVQHFTPLITRGIAKVEVLDPAGRPIAWEPAMDIPGNRVTYADRQYFRDAMRLGHTVISEPMLSRAQRRPVVVWSSPVMGAQGLPIAVVIAIMDLRSSQMMREIQSPATEIPNGYSFISTEGGSIAMHTDDQLVGTGDGVLGTDADVVAEFRKTGVRQLLRPNTTGVPSVFTFANIPGTPGWTWVSVDPKDAILAPAVRKTHQALAIAGFGVLLTIIFTVLAGWRALRPLSVIQRFAKDLAPLSGPSKLAMPRAKTRLEQSVRDALMTALKAKEAAITNVSVSTSLLRTALNSVAEGVIGVDAKGTVIAMNQAAAALLDWRVIDAVGQPLTKVYVPLLSGSREPAPLPIELVMNSLVPLTRAEVLEVQTRNGQPVAVDETVTPVMADGVRAGLVVVLKDARKARAEASARAAAGQSDEASGLLKPSALHPALSKLLDSARAEGTRHALLAVGFAAFEHDGALAPEEWANVGARVREILRLGDSAFRWTDGSVLVAMVNCDLAEAMFSAEKLLDSLRSIPEIQPCCGVHCFEGGYAGPLELVEDAHAVRSAALAKPGTPVVSETSAGAGLFSLLGPEGLF